MYTGPAADCTLYDQDFTSSTAPLAAAGHDADRLTFVQAAPQTLLNDVRVVRNQGVGCLQQGTAGTVVLLQLDDVKLGVVGGQLLQVFRLCPAPAIDGLVVVTDRSQASILARQQSEA